MCGRDYYDPADELYFGDFHSDQDLASPRQSGSYIRASRSDATAEYLAGERIGYGIAIGVTLASLVVGFAAACKMAAKWLFF